MLRVRTLLVTLAMAAAMLVVPQVCLACSCIQMTFAEASDQAEVIFVGTATGSTDSDTEFGPGFDVAFTVDQVYKGSTSSQTVVRTADNSAACGFAFETGKTYLVMAGQAAEVLETNLCTGTALADAVSADDLASLGDPRAPEPGTAPQSEASGGHATGEPGNSALRWGMGGLGLTALAMMGVIWWPRRAKEAERG